MANAFVSAHDKSVRDDLVGDLCSSGTCVLSGTTDASGNLDLVVPVSDMLHVFVKDEFSGTGHNRVRQSDHFIEGCPSGQTVNVPIWFGRGFTELTSVTDSGHGGVISWSPAIPAVGISTIYPGIGVLWNIWADGSQRFDGPISYGSIPTGAIQTVPTANQAPNTPNTGNYTTVSCEDFDELGYFRYWSGSHFYP